MATQARVRAMLDAGIPYEEVARRLGISPGLAYLIATGRPADGSDTVTPEQRTPYDVGASQRFANPKQAENPTTKGHVLDWVKQRALSDPQMLRASADRTAEPGEIKEPDDTELVAVLTRQHNQVTALLKQLSTIPGVKQGGSEQQKQRRKSIVDMITVKLSQHESAEEELLWPMVRKELDNGDELADTALEQEQKGQEILTDLGKLSPDEEQFDDLVEELALRLRQHVTHEEKVFLQLREQLAEDQRQTAGKRIRQARKLAPTRPHKRAPNQPGPAVAAAGAPAAAVDRLRDATGRRPAARKGKAPGEAAGKRRQAAEAEAERNSPAAEDTGKSTVKGKEGDR
jgi:hemerythrin-like domain-containing protein